MDQTNKNNAWFPDAAPIQEKLKQRYWTETETEKLKMKTMLDFQMWLNMKKLNAESTRIHLSYAFDLDKDNFDRRLGYWKLFSLLVKHQRRLEMYKCCTWWKPNIWVKSPACQLTQEGYYFREIQSNVWMFVGFFVKFSWRFLENKKSMHLNVNIKRSNISWESENG